MTTETSQLPIPPRDEKGRMRCDDCGRMTYVLVAPEGVRKHVCLSCRRAYAVLPR